MEKSLSRRRAICLIVALTLSCHAPLSVAGGGVTGGATEFTQVANKKELIASYAEHVEMVLNTTQTSLNTLENLRRLPEGVLSKMSSQHLDQVYRMARMHGNFSSIYKRTRQLQADLENINNISKNVGVDPDQVVQIIIAKSRDYGEEISRLVQTEIENAEALQKEIEALQENHDFRKINSSVNGLQQVAALNTVMVHALGDINQTLSRANQIQATEIARREGITEANRKIMEELDKRRMDAYKKLVDETVLAKQEAEAKK